MNCFNLTNLWRSHRCRPGLNLLLGVLGMLLGLNPSPSLADEAINSIDPTANVDYEDQSQENYQNMGQDNYQNADDYNYQDDNQLKYENDNQVEYQNDNSERYENMNQLDDKETR